MPRRRLSRRAKDLVCMRQLAACGYCGRDLCDAFEVDHVNECCADDRESNLVATCALCHAIKSRHVRLGRDWSSMRQVMDQSVAAARGRWRCGEAREMHRGLPEWLRRRVNYVDAHLYQVSLRTTVAALDLERFRHTPAPPPNRRNGSRGS